MAYAIEAHGLTKYFGATKIFENLELTLDKGEKAGLIGANGAGKTTLLNCLCGKEKLDEGNVRFAAFSSAGYLEQIQDIDETKTLTEAVMEAFAAVSYTHLDVYKRQVSTCDDPQGRMTVIDLLPVKERLYPVGRLDYLTEGLLILTNDGELAQKLTHPRNKINKTYLVEVDGLLTDEKAELLRRGIRLEDEMCIRDSF